MTRFARAKGSKASNERVPEDATPWALMKEQLQRAKEDAEYSKKREEAEKQRIENYENFLKEQKTAKKKSTWCEFPMNNDWSVNKPSQKKINKLIKKNELEQNNSIVDEKILNANNDSVGTSGKKKNKKRKFKDEVNATEQAEIPQKETKSVKHSDDKIDVEEEKVVNQDDNNESSKKQKKKKNKKAKLNKEPAQHSEVTQIDVNSEDINQTETNITPKLSHNNKNSNQRNQNLGFNYDQSKQETQKKKKKDGNKKRRKPEVDTSFQIIINGRQMDLVRYDGFPVMKKDAERLKQLREDMAKKGIPKREIERTMKLERRRAEKALARVKRDVCYNCRKGGHNLSDCPDLKSRIPSLDDPGVETADGICFKCGSTEHRQSECKVQKGQQFRFASCFICKEQGHIARQCPDNPKGLYPNGGGCKLCGDVTHLRKDCPTTKDDREESTARLDTMATAVDNVEGIEAPVAMTTTSNTAKKPKKIKF